MRASVEGRPTSHLPRPIAAAGGRAAGTGSGTSGASQGREALRILALCVGAAVIYGVAHDLVTAHVCVEYFTIGHPDLFGTEQPVLLALGWGVVATWYVGAVLAIPLICAARLGTAPRAGWRDLVRPLAVLLAIMAVCAVIGWFVAHALARSGRIVLQGDPALLVDRDRHALFLGNLGAHLASYASGFLGGLILPVVVWIRRGRTWDVGRGTLDVPA